MSETSSAIPVPSAPSKPPVNPPVISIAPPGEASLADQIAAKKDAIAQAKAAIETKSGHGQVTGWWSTGNAMTMCCSVLIFGLIVLLALSYQIKRYNITDHESRLYIITLVIVSALFLVVAGYSDSQIAPVMGLLGTITGFVLRGAANPVVEQPVLRVPKPQFPTGIQQP